MKLKKAAINQREENADAYKPDYSPIPILKWIGNQADNGTFTTDTIWTKGTGWTIAAGVASSDGTQSADSDLTQTLTCTINKTQNISFTVSGYSAGNVACVFDGTEVIADKAANGTYTTSVLAESATPDIDIRADLDFIGNIDNVSVREAYEIPLTSKVHKVFDAGLLLREDTADITKDYAIADDGFVKTIVPTVASGLEADVLIEYYKEI